MSSIAATPGNGPKTAVVLVDPYNDFLHADGKFNKLVRESLEATDTNTHLREMVDVARRHRIPIYYALHKTWKQGNYDGWQHMNASTTRIQRLQAFAEGSWGAEIFEGLQPDILGNGDVVVSKHWNSSGFAHTDLDYQLRQREITHLVMAGMVANTCLEATARYARELGYHVTLLTDATAGFTTVAKDTAIEHVWPIIAEKVVTVGQWASELDSNISRHQRL